MTRRLLILGSGGHGRVVADAALSAGGWDEIGFVDNTPGLAGTEVMGLKVIAASLDGRDPGQAALHVALGDNAARRRISEALAAKGWTLATIRHPSAVISRFARLEDGVAVIAGAVVNCGAEIGRGTIINTGARIDHDCVIGAYAHVSPGAVLAGTVTLGEEAWIGAGAALRNGVTIGPGVTVGVGAVVVADLIGPGKRFAGVPAREI